MLFATCVQPMTLLFVPRFIFNKFAGNLRYEVGLAIACQWIGSRVLDVGYRVDNLGAYRIPPETGILIPSVFIR